MININRINPHRAPFWSDLDQFFNRALGQTQTSNTTRRFRVEETDSAWTLRTDLPGFAKEDVNVSVEDGLLKVSATETDENPGFVSGFNQRLQLPREVDRSKVSARLQNGVLEISLPKAAEEEAQSINIDVN